MAVTGLLASRIIIPVAIISVPAHAQASILSLVTSLFSSKAAEAAEPVFNNSSQKMALLEAPVNVNVRATLVSSELLVDDSALMPVTDSLSEGEGRALSTGSGEIKTYKVQSGDTIIGIAKKFAVSANTILWANNLSRTATLKEGQNLVILPISGVQHKVKSGDTLQAIAKKYKGDVDEIIAYNDIQGDKLKVGEVIVVPDGEIITSAPSTKTKTTTPKAIATIDLQLISESSSGFYVRPLKGGRRSQGLHGTNAIDIAAVSGTPIYAAASGEVIVSKNNDAYNGGFGNYVVISHSNGSQTLYAHMTTTGVAVGAIVVQGQYIGTVGDTGRSTGPHLHFEIRNGIRNPF